MDPDCYSHKYEYWRDLRTGKTYKRGKYLGGDAYRWHRIDVYESRTEFMGAFTLDELKVKAAVENLLEEAQPE